MTGYGAQWGNYTDIETGLVLMGFRYYAPPYARFLTRDPLGYEGGINVYAYCRNNPIMRADPDGLQNVTLKEATQETFSLYRDSIGGNNQLTQQVVGTTSITVSATYTYLGGASTAGPIGVAAVAIPTAAYLVYNFSGVPLANYWFGPQTLDNSPASPGFASLYARARMRMASHLLDSIIADPSQLQGQSLADVQSRLQNLPSGWVTGTLQRGSQAGNGWTLRSVGPTGNLTDRYIQYHPGGGHHGELPYWKVSSGVGGTQRFLAK